MSVWALLLAGNLCETSAPPSPQAAPTSLPHETNAGAKKFSRVDVFTYLVRGLARKRRRKAAGKQENEMREQNEPRAPPLTKWSQP